MSEVEKCVHTEIERALFEGQIQGVVVAFYENERPPSGLAGIMDWHFQGALSKCIQTGAITGRVGECAYLPLTRSGVTYHLILAGAGKASSPGEREPLPNETLQTLQKNLTSLKITKMGISRSDFGDVKEDYLSRHLKGASLWTAP